MQKKIVFANLDTQFLEMYEENGEKIRIAQRDPRIGDLVAKVFPAIDTQGYYLLVEEDLLNANHYAESEKNLGGVVKFFRMAKKKLAEFLGKGETDLSPKEAGKKPVPPTQVNTTKAQMEEALVEEAPPAPVEGSNTEMNSALAEIMQNATPVGSPAFTQAGPLTEDETIIAVIDDKSVIPGIEKIENQLMSIAQKLGSVEGVSNFFRRLATVERAHSVQDLLTFMEKGELPIADDGSILVYKLLNRHGQGESLYFTDVHSGNVKQKVGSKVFMAEKLVDPNRNRECSNGLHIARRDYLRSFSGNACMLCKLAPEDVIAVPHNDARKLRAKGYFIVAELSDADRRLVVANKPMQDKVLLGNVAAGNHTAMLETVEITKSQGGGVVITNLQQPKTEIVLDESKKSESLDSLEQSANVVVDARELALKTAEPKVQAPPAGMVVKSEPVGKAQQVPAPPKDPVVKLSRIQQLVQDFEAAKKGSRTEYFAALAVLKYKRDSKKNWTVLGVPTAIFDRVQEIAKGPEPEQQQVVKAQPAKKAAKPKPAPKAKAPVKAKPVVDKSKVKLSQADRANELWDAFKLSPTRANAEAVLKFKQSAKKGWSALGLPADAGDRLSERLK